MGILWEKLMKRKNKLEKRNDILPSDIRRIDRANIYDVIPFVQKIDKINYKNIYGSNCSLSHYVLEVLNDEYEFIDIKNKYSEIISVPKDYYLYLLRNCYNFISIFKFKKSINCDYKHIRYDTNNILEFLVKENVLLTNDFSSYYYTSRQDEKYDISELINSLIEYRCFDFELYYKDGSNIEFSDIEFCVFNDGIKIKSYIFNKDTMVQDCIKNSNEIFSLDIENKYYINILLKDKDGRIIKVMPNLVFYKEYYMTFKLESLDKYLKEW